MILIVRSAPAAKISMVRISSWLLAPILVRLLTNWVAHVDGPLKVVVVVTIVVSIVVETFVSIVVEVVPVVVIIIIIVVTVAGVSDIDLEVCCGHSASSVALDILRNSRCHLGEINMYNSSHSPLTTFVSEAHLMCGLVSLPIS